MNKKKLLLVAFTFFPFWATAQIDTLQYMDPWYLFNSRENPNVLTMQITSDNSVPNSFLPNLNGSKLEEYYSQKSQDLSIYGVAIVMDTMKHTYTYLYPGTYQPVTFSLGSNTSMFKAVLMRASSPESLFNGSGISRSFSVVDTAFFDNSTRHISFKFRDSSISPNIFERYVSELRTFYDCYEFYFDTPISANAFGDTVYVGYVYHGRTDTNNFGIEVHEWGVDAYHDYAYRPAGWACNQYQIEFTDTSAEYHCPGNGAKFGGIFPIVSLRCTAPKNLRETGRGYNSLSIVWDSHDDATGWQASISPVGSNINLGTIVDLDNDATRFTFQNLDPEQSYLYSVRKKCHFATSAYDTTVLGEWHPVRQFRLLTNGISSTTSASFSFAPNPSTSHATLTLASPALTGTILDLYSASGALLRSFNIPAGTATLQLDLRDLPSGILLLQLHTPSGTSIQKLLHK